MPLVVSSDRSIALGSVLADLNTGVGLSEIAVHVPATVEVQVREMIGRRWRVPAADVQLEWGAAPGECQITTNARFRLVGEGADGWFAVVFRNPGAPGAAIRLRAGVDYRVPVAARRLFAGRIIGDEDILFQKISCTGPPAASTRHAVEPGWRVIHDLETGEHLLPPAVLPQRVIAAGDTVRLKWCRGVVTVALEGTALHDAALGERIVVSLRRGRGESSGIVSGPGEAALDG